MDSATPLCSSNKEKDNFARLCRLLIMVGPSVLTEIFNKVCSPKDLNSILHTNRSKLESLKKKRVLSIRQWLKLYPPVKLSSFSSRDFEPSLQLLLLRSIFGPHLPASCQDNFPSATDTSPLAGFTLIKVLRDKIYRHDTSGSVDDPTFNSYWSEIEKTFLCFGGSHYRETINDLKVNFLDEDLREEYQKQFRKWMRDDASPEDKLGEVRVVKKARKEEDMEGAIDISEQISGREEPKLFQHAHGGAAENTKSSLPELSINIPKISELPEKCSEWVNVELPVDIVLFTVEEVEFLSCFAILKNPVKIYYIGTGVVYFCSMEDEQGYKIKIALMRCSNDHDGPGGALSSAKDAILHLQPKALISVGTCSGLKSTTIKLGDVVLSSKVITPALQIPPRRYVSRLINHIADGWKQPVRDANGYEAKVHTGTLLSIPEANKDIIRQYPQAIALNKNSGGFCTAANDSGTEWLIVMGIEGFVNDIQSSINNWKEVASVMAASVVAKIFSDPKIFQDWPHSYAATSLCSAAPKAFASKPSCTLL